MTNRLASLFTLDELLAAPAGRRNGGNGHHGYGAPDEPHRKGAPRKRQRGGTTGTPAPTDASSKAPTSGASRSSRSSRSARCRARGAVSQSFDTGAPIHCEHTVPYPAPPPVDVAAPSVAVSPSAPPPAPPVARAHALSEGAAYHVEAFEDEDAAIEEPTTRLSSDVEQEEVRAASYAPDEATAPPLPRESDRAEPTEATREADSTDERALPASFAAQMRAVEDDLAALAARATHPAPNASAPANQGEVVGDATDGGSADRAPAPRASPGPVTTNPGRRGHEVFDAMAKGMSYATEFRLPSLQLSQVFSALDRQLDAQPEPAREPSSPTDGGEAAIPMPGGDVLLADLARMAPAGSAPVTSRASGGDMAAAASASGTAPDDTTDPATDADLGARPPYEE